MQDEVLYRFARCKQPLTMRLMWNHGLPLPESQLEVVDAALRWEQLRVGLPFVLPWMQCNLPFSIDCVQLLHKGNCMWWSLRFAGRSSVYVCPLLHAPFPLVALCALSCLLLIAARGCCEACLAIATGKSVLHIAFHSWYCFVPTAE